MNDDDRYTIEDRDTSILVTIHVGAPAGPLVAASPVSDQIRPAARMYGLSLAKKVLALVDNGVNAHAALEQEYERVCRKLDELRLSSIGGRTAAILEEIAKERDAQDDQWGTAHDDQHEAAAWACLISGHTGRLSIAAVDGDVTEYRRRLIVIGALATAAAESLDRVREAHHV